jgi:hypothetical protein
MAFQYVTGTRINATFTTTATGSTGKREILYNVCTQLVAAGWTVTTGTLTATTDDIVVASVATPAGHRMKLRFDTAGTNCCRIRVLKYSNETVGQAGGHYLLPAVSKNWRVICNGYQVFVMELTGSNSRSHFQAGCPWVPSFLSLTENIWSGSNSVSDSDASGPLSLRTSLTGQLNQYGNLWCLTNTNAVENHNNLIYSQNYTGGPALLSLHRKSSTALAENVISWVDGTQLMYDPLICWPDSAISSTAASTVKGQLWDAAIISGPYLADQSFTDSNGIKWYVYTDNYNYASITMGPGTLLLRIP